MFQPAVRGRRLTLLVVRRLVVVRREGRALLPGHVVLRRRAVRRARSGVGRCHARRPILRSVLRPDLHSVLRPDLRPVLWSALRPTGDERLVRRDLGTRGVPRLELCRAPVVLRRTPGRAVVFRHHLTPCRPRMDLSSSPLLWRASCVASISDLDGETRRFTTPSPADETTSNPIAKGISTDQSNGLAHELSRCSPRRRRPQKPVSPCGSAATTLSTTGGGASARTVKT